MEKTDYVKLARSGCVAEKPNRAINCSSNFELKNSASRALFFYAKFPLRVQPPYYLKPPLRLLP